MKSMREALRNFLPESTVSRVIFVLLLALGIFLRVAGLDWGIPPRENAASFYHDEGHQLAFVEMDWETFRTSFGYYELARPVMFLRVVGRPLFAIGRALGLDDGRTRVFELVTLRSIMAAFAIAGLLAVYALGRAVGTTATGLWALAFLAVMPGHWYYANVIKGDIMMATMFTVLLLVAIRLVEDGRWSTYLWTGALLGFGTVLKITMLAAAPALLVAHILRAIRLRSFRALVSPRAGVAAVLAVVVFFSLYPYPFINPPLFWKEHGGPSGFLSFRALVPPATYAAVWEQYNGADRPFMDMIFGRFLRAALLPAVAAAAVAGVWWLFRLRDSRLFLAVVFAAAFAHSLTFVYAFDDRYVLPASPYVALFAALAASAAWLPSSRWRLARGAGLLLGALLLLGTAAITGKLFPMFGLFDPREEAVQWVTSEAAPGALVAQPVLLSRWSLVFDRSKVRTASLITGQETDRRVTRLATPQFVLVQREPWNYDHTFRYELEGVRGPFDTFLQTFERVRTFGREPTLYRTLLPRNLGAPVIDVYRRARDLPTRVLLGLEPKGPLEVQGFSVRVFPHAFTPADLERAFVRVTVDLGKLRKTWKSGGERIRIGVLALWDEQRIPAALNDLPEESALLTRDAAWGWLASIQPKDIEGHEKLTLVLDHPEGHIWDAYDGFDGSVSHRASGTREFRRVRFAVVTQGPNTGAGSLEVAEAFVGRLSDE